jgi:hypothetical protein
MKPRLEVPQSAYTQEDAAIWLTVCPTIRHLLTWARYSDRRDADLMLQCADYRVIGAYANVRQVQTMAGQDGCAVRGEYYSWVSPKWSDGRNITSCA